MANPFLFEDVADYGDTAASSNPFLCGPEEPVNDNPFLASVSTAPGTNPFADYSWDEPTGNDGLLTPPPITNINDPENDFIASSDDEASKPRRPPPPRPSMPKETQDLILSVTGALKATSDNLLDRLPPTRAPSPTTFADLHSPSPTPDLLGGDDFFGVGQQPARPPPPRPPARPAPPPVPPAPVKVTPPQPVQSDMFDLFGTPSAAPLPKSNDAILNLYSQPKPQAPPKDLLNDNDDVELQAPLMSSEPLLSEPVVEIVVADEVKPPTPAESPKAPEVVPVAEPKEEEPSYIFGTRPSLPTDPATAQDPELPAPPTPADDVPPAQNQSIFGFSDEAPQPDFGTTEPSAFELEPEPQYEESSHSIFGTGLVHSNDASHIFGSEPEDAPQIFGVGPSEPETASQLFGVGPPEIETASQLFGVGPEVETASQLFGVGPPEVETAPQLFGVGPPEEETPSQLFGVGPQETASQLFGVPDEDPVPQLFGAVPLAAEPAPQIFGAGPPPVEKRVPPPVEPRGNIFGVGPPPVEPRPSHIFGVGPPSGHPAPTIFGVGPPADPLDAFAQPAAPVDAFDAFSAKFDGVDGKKAPEDAFDPFSGRPGPTAADTWGSGVGGGNVDQSGFGGEDSFDAFLSMSQPPPVPQPTPSHLDRTESADSEEGGFNIFIKPREGEVYPQPGVQGPVPALAPPPKSPAYADNDPRFNPFDKNGQIPAFPLQDGFQLPALSQSEPFEGGFKRTDSQETPTTPLFDEDISQPLEEFPRIQYSGDGWEMQLRQPNKKKITGQRFWKKIFVKLVYQGDNPVLQLFNLKEDKDPFQELPLQACYSVSEICAQQYDQFGKIFTVKLQYIFYKERPGVRPGQVTKAERITNKLSQFAAYAIQGDYQGCKEFGSDLKKLGLPVEHAPQISQLLKIGCMAYEDLKQFSVTIEECLFRMPVHRDRALTYKMEEVQMTVVDEMFVEQDAFGHVEKQIARVRVFFLAFLSGMPDVELGMNDMWRQGKEVVGRHDIIPVVTEEWIRLESVEFHSCVQLDEYEKTRTIKFKPPDACYIELMRFRIRPPKNRELPLQLKAVMCVTGNRVELRADVLVPGFTSRKLGQIPCEDVMIRFPIPECWIYLFRVEKHFRYGSVKSAHRRTGKIKGIERFLGAVENMEPSLMEVTSGQAKYEHQHRAIVWRMPRLPKEGQGAYTTHNLVCRMQLTSFDQIPDNLADYAYVEFTMPATTASHTTVRSVSLVDSPSDNPPEKYVRQLARLEYRVGIEHTQGEEMASYVAATVTKPKPPPPAEAPAPSPVPAADSDSDSSG